MREAASHLPHVPLEGAQAGHFRSSQHPASACCRAVCHAAHLREDLCQPVHVVELQRQAHKDIVPAAAGTMLSHNTECQAGSPGPQVELAPAADTRDPSKCRRHRTLHAAGGVSLIAMYFGKPAAHALKLMLSQAHFQRVETRMEPSDHALKILKPSSRTLSLEKRAHATGRHAGAGHVLRQAARPCAEYSSTLHQNANPERRAHATGDTPALAMYSGRPPDQALNIV